MNQPIRSKNFPERAIVVTATGLTEKEADYLKKQIRQAAHAMGHPPEKEITYLVNIQCQNQGLHQ